MHKEYQISVGPQDMWPGQMKAVVGRNPGTDSRTNSGSSPWKDSKQNGLLGAVRPSTSLPLVSAAANPLLSLLLPLLLACSHVSILLLLPFTSQCLFGLINGHSFGTGLWIYSLHFFLFAEPLLGFRPFLSSGAWIIGDMIPLKL